jgi:uroporphyrinogen-III synthase
LNNYIAEKELGDLRFLLLKEINSESEIKNELIKAGAEVYELPVYQIKFPKEIEIPKLKALLKGGAIDEFIFSAPTDFIALKYIFNNESMASIFAEIEVSAADGLVFQAAREQNLKHAGLFRPDKVDKVER